MSRTLKDVKWEVRFPETKYDYGREQVPYMKERRRFDPTIGNFVPTGELVTSYTWIEKPGVKTKKPKNCNQEWDWIGTTPGWWNRLFHTKPQRRKAHLWEREMQKVTTEDDLEEADLPHTGNKPHKYYY